jgi:hypothetical protein
MDESKTIRVSVEEAATLLGIEKGSVKKRIQRGKLLSEKDASGTIWVYLDRSETVRDQSQGRSETDRDELVVELRDRVRSLESRLDEEGESRRRSDTIIAQLTQANAALTERLRELEAPQSPSEPVQEPAEAVAGVPATQGAGEAAESPTEPRWMRSKWANWLIPVLLSYVLPIGITALGTVWVYIRAINEQVPTAVLGTIATLVAVGISMYFGIRSTSKTTERAQREVEEANLRVERANARAAMQPQKRQREHG